MPTARSPWAVVGALGVTQIIAWGSVYYAFALLVEPLAAATASTKPTVVGAFSVALLVAGVASAPMGRWLDRHGGRSLMTTGSLAAALLLALLSQVNAAWQLYAVFAGLGGVMAATLYDPAFTVLAQVFQHRQRKAVTVLTLFGGFASTVFWPLTQWLIASLGWQHALLVLALLQALVCAPLHALLLPRQHPNHAAHNPVQRAASASMLRGLLRDRRFYGLCAAFTGHALVFSALSVHLIPLLQGKGLSLAEAAWVGALVGPMQVLGRIVEYAFLSRLPVLRVGLVALWLLPASLALLAFVGPETAPLALFALLYGAGNGMITIVRGAIPAELYGHTHYGAVNGAMATPVLIAKAAGPIAASWVLAGAASPLALVGFLGAVGVVSAGLFMLAMPPRDHPPLSGVQR